MAPVCGPAVRYCPPVTSICAAKSQCTDSVNEGGSIQLHGTIRDPDNNVVKYVWTADKGTFDDPTSLDPTYYAPMTNACEGEYACITLTAVDSCCTRGVDQLILHINNVNHLPTADAGGDITISGGTNVQLTCSASDPDGDALSYYWTASCGGGCFSNPRTLHPVYTAPFTDGCKQQDIVLTLTVTDACGASASDSMTAHVNPIVNTSPTVHVNP
jgi:protocatechuate 3,4-dioxygenase beta subunit